MKNAVSKVQLSKKEIGVLSEQEFFHSKKIVTQKIFHQLSDVVKEIKLSASFQRISFPAGTDTSTGKISKGENYLGLPFVILDFPRRFSKDQILAFRTMIWWGNFLSNTLLLSVHDSKQSERLAKRLSKLKGKEIFFSVSDSPWHHHFERENYVLLDLLTEKEIVKYLSGNKFLKVARKLSLNKINRLKGFSVESFEIFSRLM